MPDLPGDALCRRLFKMPGLRIHPDTLFRERGVENP
jgi:hypothetical protein